MKNLLDRLRHLRLRQILFLLLLVSGMIPLAISSTVLILMNRDLLTTQEKSYLTRSAESLSWSLDAYFRNARTQQALTGEALLANSGEKIFEDRLREPWVMPFLERTLQANPDLRAMRILNRDGAGPFFGAAGLPSEVSTALDEAFLEAQRLGEPVYDLRVEPGSNIPLALLSVPVGDPEDEAGLIVESVAQLPMKALLAREAPGAPSVFLIDSAGDVLWAEGADEVMRDAMSNSDLARDFAQRPLSLTREYDLNLGDSVRRMQGQVSPVAETGWGVVVQKPLVLAFTDVRRMIWNAVLSTSVLLLLAAFIAVAAARAGSRPIDRLAETSHEIAAGNFGQRVDDDAGFGLEILTLAGDFNRMSGHVEKYVEDLRQAAQANRELFIGSVRAFSAAIDAKDPYTLGHSERVAQHSRVLADYLNMPDDFRQRIWLCALLHDVGKIGITDEILQKVGKLTDDEYTVMKRHPVIGEEILRPIEQLADTLPGIRSHHEAWNGEGYPDGLKGEEIPMLARIVTIADTFDAITTHRPYQTGHSSDYAAQVITDLAGTRFDTRVVSAFVKAYNDRAIVDPRQSIIDGSEFQSTTGSPA